MARNFLIISSCIRLSFTNNSVLLTANLTFS